LTKKHKIAISGCGCCGSPFFEDIPEINIYDKYILNDAYSGQIVYVQPDDYYWKANNVVCT
jgi:hypothetical protein